MRETIHDMFVDALNAAGALATPVSLFRGNFLFQFHQEGMTVYSAVTGTLVTDELEYSPVCLSVLEETPFAEKNGRSDWLAVFQIMFRIQGNEYDATDDPSYALIKGVCATLNGTVQTISTTKIAVKCREPKYLGMQITGKDLFVIVEVGMNLTTGTNVKFGTSCSYTLGGTAIDVVNFTKTFTRRYRVHDSKTTNDPDYSTPIGSIWCGVLRFNWWGDTTQLSEINGTASLTAHYSLIETEGTNVTTWDVSVENATEDVAPGALRRFVFTLRKVS